MNKQEIDYRATVELLSKTVNLIGIPTPDNVQNFDVEVKQLLLLGWRLYIFSLGIEADPSEEDRALGNLKTALTPYKNNIAFLNQLANLAFDPHTKELFIPGPIQEIFIATSPESPEQSSAHAE